MNVICSVCGETWAVSLEARFIYYKCPCCAKKQSKKKTIQSLEHGKGKVGRSL